MIKLSKLTDYAVVVLGAMTAGQEKLHTAAGLSARTSLPEPTVSKVLKHLTKGGLICSSRGINGGYKLLKSPADVTMADIVRALEGPVQLTACVEGNHEGCSLSGTCAMKGKWNPLNTAIKTALENVTLAQMIAVPERPGL